ncbi:MAG: twitching motility protein PilT [Anaerolineales bacterium]|nr:twitching motility protein PilT [Anaerolineales bacterium]
MNSASFRFYAELNDFLPQDRRHTTFEHAFSGNPAVKDTIESLGVPHTEVDLILVDGVSVDFTYRLKHGDEVSVYPVFETLDITPLLRLRPKPLREPRFVLDAHLGRLARYLRMAGFDAEYRNDFDDQTLAHISSSQRRILLTRDRGLLKRSEVTHGYCVRETNPREQLKEVLRRFDLLTSLSPFRRCLRCNSLLETVPKEEILDQLLPKTLQNFEEFRQCRGCGQIYWRGSHFERMQRFIEHLLAGPS